MNAHEVSEETLALAAAGALSTEESVRVQRHAQSCEACRQELETWATYARALRELPRVEIPVGLARRAHARVMSEQAAVAEAQWNRRLVIGSAVFAGISGTAFLLLVQSIAGSVSGALWWSGVSMVLTWATAGAAAVLLRSRRGGHYEQT